jgi:hypothetical protein
LKNPVSKTITFLLLLVIVVLNLLNPAANILSWDVFGYYLYLPLTFIYRDLSLENIQLLYEIFEQYQPSNTLYQVFRSPEGEWVLKYSAGLAILHSPFFLTGHIIASLSPVFPADGFSLPYQRAVAAGCMLYTVIALLMLRKILVRFFSDRITALVMLIVVLGTNYFYYMTMVGQNSNPQNFGFMFYTLITWYTIRWHENRKMRYAILLGIFCGLNILSRPTEIVCLLIPLLWGVYDRETLRARMGLLREKRKQILVFTLILVTIGSIQFTYWKMASGHFLYYSYGNRGGEGLDLWHPYLLKVMFSFRKGWLIYTPVMIFSLIGFRSLYKRNKSLFFPVLAYFILNLYLVSCWSTWWYADCYGQRALVPSYVLLAIPLGYFLVDLTGELRRWKWYSAAIILAFMVLSMFQTWQYTRGIIHTSRMTRDYYFRIFARRIVTEEDRKLLLVSRDEWPVEHVPDETDYLNSQLYFKAYCDSTGIPVQTHSLPGDTGSMAADTAGCYRLDEQQRFTPAFKAVYRDHTKKDHLYFRASAEVFIPEGGEAPLIVMAFEHKRKLYKYNTTENQQEEIRFGEWNQISMDYLSPELRSRSDKLSAYLWYRGESFALVRNIEVRLFEPKVHRR